VQHRGERRETAGRRIARRGHCAEEPELHISSGVVSRIARGKNFGPRTDFTPGPNNPIGVAWIGLDKTGYGIHGTPNPEQVGRTESHGCFRLANWDAEYLSRLVRMGMPVLVEP